MFEGNTKVFEVQQKDIKKAIEDMQNLLKEKYGLR